MLLLSMLIAFSIACALAVIWMCHKAPLMEDQEDEEDRLARYFIQQYKGKEKPESICTDKSNTSES